MSDRDLNDVLDIEKSYVIEGNKKPLHKTRFMVDELGNLQSKGQGIEGFETILTTGLGREHQFTLILQVPQPLKDVQGNIED